MRDSDAKKERANMDEDKSKLNREDKFFRFLFEDRGFALVDLSPIGKSLISLGIPYPDCWIAVGVKSDFLRDSLPNPIPREITWDHTLPGDFDVIAGPMEDGAPADLVVALEVKRFPFNNGVIKHPSGYGRLQVKGYLLFGFDRVMLTHIVVANPLEYQGSNWIGNAANVAEGMDTLQRKKLDISDVEFYGYSIGGWSEVPGGTPDPSGGFRFSMLRQPSDNPLRKHEKFIGVRDALFNRIRQAAKSSNYQAGLGVPLLLDEALFRDAGKAASK